jgi:hypothetical protein
MENQQTPEVKSNKKIVWICFFVFLFVGIVFSALVWAIVSDKRELAEKNAKLQQEQGVNFTCASKRDSLIKEVKQLSIYKSLTKGMVHRDEATSLLKYKIGDFVYMKRDSARVVISDIIIGGSKYEYYIKYEVLHKDNSTEKVIPELIY